jgi:hypothetical protein
MFNCDLTKGGAAPTTHRPGTGVNDLEGINRFDRIFFTPTIPLILSILLSLLSLSIFSRRWHLSAQSMPRDLFARGNCADQRPRQVSKNLHALVFSVFNRLRQRNPISAFEQMPFEITLMLVDYVE